MRLDEIARSFPFAKPLAVPAWTLGCFKRRCISFADGSEDPATTVIRLQSHGLTGDIRIAAARPYVKNRASLSDCTVEELIELGKVEGGVGKTSYRDGQMHWANWVGFQPYDKWTEPGALVRIGNTLLEFAPNGIYTEDWRLQPDSSGLLVGLRLVSEMRGGIETPRDGGLLVNGDHALMTLGRREALLLSDPVQRQIANAVYPHALAAIAFDCQTVYAHLAQGTWHIEHSTDPFAEGQALEFGDFSPAGQGYVTQATDGVIRRWQIDTLLADQDIPLATPATQAGKDWLAREIKGF